MVTFRRTVQAFTSAYVAAWVARGIVALTDPSRGVAIAIFVAATVLGAGISWRTSRSVDPWSAQDLRDGAIGWGLVGGLILALLCVLLPTPWNAIAAVAIVLATIVTASWVHRHADALGATDGHDLREATDVATPR